jgi:hypothetical protein
MKGYRMSVPVPFCPPDMRGILAVAAAMQADGMPQPMIERSITSLVEAKLRWMAAEAERTCGHALSRTLFDAVTGDPYLN